MEQSYLQAGNLCATTKHTGKVASTARLYQGHCVRCCPKKKKLSRRSWLSCGQTRTSPHDSDAEEFQKFFRSQFFFIRREIIFLALEALETEQISTFKRKAMPASK